ncbi:radical SAM protein [Puia dinghuensis]|nr:radical SAM protein [Puia dinghuensis]
MSYKLNRRRLKKIINRLRNLPGGINFFKYSFNKLHGAFLKATKSTRVPYPSSIMLEVTNHCNLGCITCPREYAFGQEMDKGTIEAAQMFKVIDEVAPYVDSIGLTGLGETLLYKKLEETLKYIKQKNKGIQTFISTNAHIPNAAAYIGRMAPYLDTVQISIDGVGSVYEQVRLKSDYSFFIETAREIKTICDANGVAVMFNFVAIKENFRQMKDVVEVAVLLGIRNVNITPVNLSSITSWDRGYYEMFYSKDFADELKMAFDLASNSGVVELSIWDIKKKNEFQKCHLPWNHFYISWDGWMTPCCAKPFPKELNFGNVFQTSLMKCLNSKGYRAFRQMWYDNTTPDFCAKCHVIDLHPIDLDFNITLN